MFLDLRRCLKMSSTRITIGSRVRVLKDYASDAEVLKGDTGVVQDVSYVDGVIVRMDNDEIWYFNQDELEAVNG